MKFILIFCLISSFFIFEAKRLRIRRYHSHSHSHRHSLTHRYHYRGPSNNILYQFILGFIAELSGAPKLIDDCLDQVPGWESAGTTEETKDETTKQMGGDTSSTLSKVLKFVGGAIDLVCAYKIKLICSLTKKARRFQRLLLQGKVRRNQSWWNPVDLWDDVKTSASKISEAVVSGAKKLGNAVKEGAQWVGKKASELGNYIKEQLIKVFKPVSDLFDSIKQKIINFYTTNPLIQKVIKFVKCFLKNGIVRAVKNLIKVFKGLITLIPTLGSPAGWVQLLVNLICGWKDLKIGVEFLLKGLKETEKLVKFNDFGKFAAHMLKACVGA